ncbi:hypothetical protein LXL04_024470 [Taraxacum kok-saghyz]
MLKPIAETIGRVYRVLATEHSTRPSNSSGGNNNSGGRGWVGGTVVEEEVVGPAARDMAVITVAMIDVGHGLLPHLTARQTSWPSSAPSPLPLCNGPIRQHPNNKPSSAVDSTQLFPIPHGPAHRTPSLIACVYVSRRHHNQPSPSSPLQAKPKKENDEP